MKKMLTTTWMFLVLCLGGSATLFAQQKQFTGTILDADGLPVKLASVQVIGTNRGTSANEQGAFTIEASTGEQLQLSAIGFVSRVFKLEQNTNLVISLTRSGSDLGEVVVTALGISRAKKTLGYAVQKLRGADSSV